MGRARLQDLGNLASNTTLKEWGLASQGVDLNDESNVCEKEKNVREITSHW